jgi:HEAT repeat protein
MMGWRRKLSVGCLVVAALVATIAPLDVFADQMNAHSGAATADAGGGQVASGRSAWLSKWVLWPLGVAEFWLVGSLSTWSIMLWVAPLKIRQINDRLSVVRIGDWQLGDGTQVTLAHLLLVRAFVCNDRVVDAWICSQQKRLSDWYAIDFEATDGVEIEIRGDRFAVEDASAFRQHVPEERACLALYGESRRWDARVLTGLLRLAAHPEADSRLLRHPLLPVVLDRKCLERLARRGDAQGEASGDGSGSTELARLLFSELQRVDGLKADVTVEWLEILLEKHRVLVVVEDWHRTPVQTRNLVIQAYQANEIAWLAIVSAGATMPALPGVIQLTAPAESAKSNAASASATSAASQVNEHPAETEVESIEADAPPALKLHTGADDEVPVADVNEVSQEQEALAGQAAEDSRHDTEAGSEGAASVVSAESELLAEAAASTESDDSAADDDAPVLVCFPTVEAGSANESGRSVEAGAAVVAAPSRETKDMTATGGQAVAVQPPAGEMLGRLGNAACSVIPTLGQALDSSNSSLRLQAVDQISEIVLTALPQLELALSDGDATVRRNAAQTLVRIEKLMTPAVAHAMNDPDVSVRREAVAALPVHEERTLEPLIAALADSHAETRQHAARALGALGSLAAPAVPSLIELLAGESSACRSEAAIALGRIGSVAIASCPALTRVLVEDSRTVRAAAAQALCRIGHADDGVVAALCEATEDSDPTVRRHAVVGLGQLGLGHAEAFAAIRGALSDGTPAIRTAACHALSELGPGAREAVADLANLLNDEAVEVRRAVVSSVSQIDLASVPLLRQALDDADSEVRRLAAAALSGIGLAVMPRLLERHDADEILAGLKASSKIKTQYGERSA